MIYGKWIPPTGDHADALALRMDVFVREQGFSEALETDALDAQSYHAVLYEKGDLVATGRLYYEGDAFHIGRFCVRKDHRGQGLGDLLLRMMLDKALQHHAARFRIDAQTQAVPFYARYGFTACGPEYLEEHVPHMPLFALATDLRLESPCAHACADCAQRTE
ncbi:MAG: GNAT family N-acetyltransferase [Clostridia bacterium]